MNGVILNIQKFCINDGPGIRTTVFLKGCPLKCEWCHNPESHGVEKQIMFYPEKCTQCGKCIKISDDTDFVCPNDAKKICGKMVSTDAIIAEVLKDEVFYKNSGGGMTLSGGEPLLQFEFALTLMKKAKEYGIHTCIETSGFCDTEKICEIARYTDVFLYDWKCTDDDLHKKYTGVSNEIIMKNLYTIDSKGVTIILRCPIIPEVNDTAIHFDGISRLVNSLKNVQRIEVEPYHSLGVGKYEKLYGPDKYCEFRVPSPDEVSRWVEEIQNRTMVPVCKA